MTCGGPDRKPIKCDTHKSNGLFQSRTPLKASRAKIDHLPGTLRSADVNHEAALYTGGHEDLPAQYTGIAGRRHSSDNRLAHEQSQRKHKKQESRHHHFLSAPV